VHLVVGKQQQLIKQKIMRFVAAGTPMQVDGTNLEIAVPSVLTFGEGAGIPMEFVNMP